MLSVPNLKTKLFVYTNLFYVVFDTVSDVRIVPHEALRRSTRWPVLEDAVMHDQRSSPSHRVDIAIRAAAPTDRKTGVGAGRRSRAYWSLFGNNRRGTLRIAAR